MAHKRLSLTRGNSHTYGVTFKNSAGIPYNIKNWVLKFTLKTNWDLPDSDASLQKIEAQAGDFIAGYAGRFEADTSGGAGYYRISGNIFGEGLQDNYVLRAGDIVSLYAEGETVSAGRKAAMHYYRNLMAGGVGRC